MQPLARIACLDLDTFFVSVERLLHPELVGRPVVVGGHRGARGVVLAASYEVRPFGVRSGISLRDADRLAPNDTVFLPGTHGVYSEYAHKVRLIAQGFTPESRVASIDEMYLDFRGCEELYRHPSDVDGDATIERVCREMTATIKRELGLPSSCGIGASKTIAKVASGVAKPAGVRLVRAGDEAAFLAPLPVRKLPGIGPVGEQRLRELGIHTLGQLAGTRVDEVKSFFGVRAGDLILRARGVVAVAGTQLGRERPAFREHDPEGETLGSISNERTFEEDLRVPGDVEARLCALVERVCWRARKRGVRARTVTLKLRYSDFETLTRSRTFHPTNSEIDVLPVVLDLYRKTRTRRTPVRLVGIQLSNLREPEPQLELELDAKERLHLSVDTIRERYGFDAVGAAGARRATARILLDEGRWAGGRAWLRHRGDR